MTRLITSPRAQRLLRLACALLALGLTWLGAAPAARAQTLSKDVARAADMIEGLHLDEAERLLAQLEAEHPGVPSVAFQRSMLAFYRGDYASAVDLSERALVGDDGDREEKSWRMLHDVEQATEVLTEHYVQVRGGDGRYLISFPEGVDRVLVPYALDVMQAMDHTLTQVMGQPVPGPIRLEIYPSAEALSQVSTLTVEQIETSGTVALCKWDRLMITSPRALVRGYPWVDTIAHELTHLYLSYVTQEKAPVWLQEGTAKMLERRWRPEVKAFALDPASRSLLEQAVHDNKLLSFEQLHPSIALLPSQNDAALAFAQVSTFMDRFVTTHGEPALRDGYALVAAGTDAREALARAAHVRFSELERNWRASLPTLSAASVAAAAPRKLARRFRAGQATTPDESEDVAETGARRYLRLGDLLWSRHHTRGAMLEYEKAQKTDHDDPIVAARLARAALEAGDAVRSLAAVDPLVARYPDHAPTHAVRGAALASLGRTDEARFELLEAIRINPFDPDPHCALAQIAASDASIKTEKSACALLRAQ